MGALRHRECQAFLHTPNHNQHFILTPTTATNSDPVPVIPVPDLPRNFKVLFTHQD
jgi:hypothetical protein